MKLRDYQSKTVKTVGGLLRQDKSPLIVAPTGSGKTVMGVEVVRRHATPTLWVAHRKELIMQAFRSLRDYCGVAPEELGIIKADIAPNPGASIQVASVGTLVNRKPLENTGLIVVDECHHVAAESYKKILEKHNAPVVGLTATPFRLDGEGLGDFFDEIIVSAYTDELIEANYLVEPTVFIGKTPSMKGVKKQGGDYSRKDAGKKCSRITGDVLRTWQEKVGDGRTIIYASSIEHSLKIKEEFERAGIPTAHLDGSTPKRERRIILLKLKTGSVKVVTNVDILTEGFDLPALDAIVIARPTQSLNLHLQMIGRVMRTAPDKKTAIVIDHAGNHYRHGPATRRIKYDLAGVNTSPPLGLRQCSTCFLMFPLTETTCPECGTEIEIKKRNVSAVWHGDGEIVEYEPFSFETQKEVFERLQDKQNASGFSQGWCFREFKRIFGFSPIVVENSLVNPENATIEEKQKVFDSLIKHGKELKYNRGWASHRYKALFGVWPKGFVKTVLKRRGVRYAR